MIKTDILKNGYKILQDSERFQFGIDAVLLANYASKALKGKENVIDLGTGTGIEPKAKQIAGPPPVLSFPFGCAMALTCAKRLGDALRNRIGQTVRQRIGRSVRLAF